MGNLDFDKARASDYSSLDAYAIPFKNVDTVQNSIETEWLNPYWAKYYGWFIQHPKVKNAILMKALWNVGKGWDTETELTKTILEHISGAGKETFKQVLFSMDVCKRIGGDAYAEIITHNGKKLTAGGKLVNLRVLNPGNVKEVYGPDGLLKRYEIINGITGQKVKFDPEEIFHLSNNKLAGSIHGLSDLEALEKVILADSQSFDNMLKITNFQAKPFILFKLKTDDDAKITTFVAKIKNARNMGEDMFIPDDENLLSYEVVQVNPSQILMEWRDDLRNEYYRTIGLPQIIPGAGGQGTESEGRVIYMAFSQIVAHEQLEIEDAVWTQLGLKIKLVVPTTIEDLVAQTMKKNGNTNLNTTPSELNPAATPQ